MKRSIPPAAPTAEWVIQARLKEVCLVMANAYTHNKTMLDGALIACLANRLIQAETQPGGPYRNESGTLDLQTNLAIGYLFTRLGKSLPQVDSFIAKQRHHESHHTATQELLTLYDTAKKYSQQSPSSIPHPSHQLIFKAAATHLSQLQPPLKEHALRFLERLRQADKNHEIALLPTYFHDSLLSPLATPHLTLLGEANVYCWMAYTVYDHIIDGEPITYYLPTANVALRLAFSRYQSLFPKSHPFQQKIMQIFTDMDTANSWELQHCRFKKDGDYIKIDSLPSYRQHHLLAKRSLAHALGPIAISYLKECTLSQLKSIEKGFHHYLIARQLNDDIHDWQEDVRSGHSSAVVTAILKGQRIKIGKHKIEPLISQMNSHFWHHSLETSNQLVQKHVHLAQRHFLQSGIVQEESPLLLLTERLGNIAAYISSERQRYKNFSSMYRQLSDA